ncbi:MAG TPA: hypothetical protein VFK13_11415 [Gemmatimonadaceae bacterium]|nr:hypothetical protein [Gemmatimonadaceae bacterium]
MTRSIATGCLIALGAALACHGDKKPAVPDTALVEDTTHVNLDTLTAALPPALPDTFTPPPRPKTRTVRHEIPPAPPALTEAVERERNVSRFCYEEFGQKRDPQLRGGVAVVVTVDASGEITDAHVEDDTWSSDAGKSVNACLDERVKVAWRLPARSVRPGQYVVQLAFRPT